MTATDTPVRPSIVATPRVRPLSMLRLLRIELRRSPMVLILPLVAALFWFDSYRPSTAQQPLWVLRTFWNMGQGDTIIDFGPFVAGMAAWIASRDGRRRTADLVTTMVRPRWTVRLAIWAAGAIWAAAAYLIFVGVLFGVYAYQGVQGQPPWWWVAVGATAVVAFSAAGFAAGTLFPSRYAAPLAAFGGFLAMVTSSRIGFASPTGWALILPTNSHGNYDQPDSGIFYPYLPDLPIARIIFLAGILAACLGLPGLPARAGGRWLRRTAAVLTLAGVAATGTAVGLAGTARLGPHGMAIPALHDAADDRPILYTPACGLAAQTPVCLNPAFRRYLPDVTTALAPVLAEVAGLPGAPQRATQVAAVYDGGDSRDAPAWTISGSPPVLRMPLGGEGSLPGRNGFQEGSMTTPRFADILRVQFLSAFVGAGPTDDNPARQAVQAALLQRIGLPFAGQPKLTGMAQAQRLAALPATAWRAWLTANLAALRSGDLTLDRVP